MSPSNAVVVGFRLEVRACGDYNSAMSNFIPVADVTEIPPGTAEVATTTTAEDPASPGGEVSPDASGEAASPVVDGNGEPIEGSRPGVAATGETALPEGAQQPENE